MQNTLQHIQVKGEKTTYHYTCILYIYCKINLLQVRQINRTNYNAIMAHKGDYEFRQHKNLSNAFTATGQHSETDVGLVIIVTM